MDINTKSILEIDLENKVVSVNSHKEKTNKLYEQVKEVNFFNLENVQKKRNVNKEPLPEISQEVNVKTIQKQIKTKNKYNKEEIASVNPEIKTAKIKTRHYNTKEKIHLSNIKGVWKERKNSKSKTFSFVSGTE